MKQFLLATSRFVFELSPIRRHKLASNRRISQLQINQSVLPLLFCNDLYNRGSLTPVSKQCAEVSSEENCTIPALPANGQEEGDVIAICLVIVDELHHEEIWRSWIEDRAEDLDEELLNRSESSQEQLQFKKRCTESSSRSRERNLNADRPDQYVVQGQSNYRNSSQNSRFRGRLFIHAKYPERVKSKWVRERMLGTILMMMTMTMTITMTMIVTMVMETGGMMTIFDVQRSLIIYHISFFSHTISFISLISCHFALISIKFLLSCFCKSLTS